MRSAFALLVIGLLAAGRAFAQPTPVCSYGQTCPAGTPQVPFPVVSPLQGLGNVLSLTHNTPPLQQLPPGQAPSQQPMAANGLAPIATPPPVLPPGTAP